MDRSRSSDRVRSSLAQQNKLESMPDVLEKEWSDFENFQNTKKSREIKFLVFWRYIEVTLDLTSMCTIFSNLNYQVFFSNP